MTDSATFRVERIEKLLKELRYEIERGLMEREIEECVLYQFYFPISRSLPGGSVHCRFEMKPTFYPMMTHDEPRLKLVKK